MWEKGIDYSMINNRLKAIASLVKEESYIIDVGCDHALLDIYLLKNRKGVRAIASDIKPGPLEQAKQNVKKYQLQAQIKVKQGNGIEPIEEEVDTVIISGMGGCHINGILKYKTHLLKNVTTLILSPNSDVQKVRKEIGKLGFFIEEEVLIFEKGIFYPILYFRRGKKKYSQEQYLLGPKLIEKREPIFEKYLLVQHHQKTKLLEILPKKYLKRRWKLKKELRIINRYL